MTSKITKQSDLTTQQIELGRIYAWIHQRAEYLRAREENSVSGPQNPLDQCKPKTINNSKNAIR
jgi:hypothetical protein